MTTALRVLCLAIALVAHLSAAADPTPGSGSYLMTIRKCDGPLANVYTPGLEVPVTIGSTGISIDGAAAVPLRQRDAKLETATITITGTRGEFSGRAITIAASLDSEGGRPAGGVAQYTVTDSAGAISGGSFHFSVARAR